MRRKYVVAVAAMLLGLAGGACGRPDDTAARFTSEVRAVNKLVLSQMTISKMATVSDPEFSKAVGMRQKAAAVIDAMKIGDRKAAYSYDTYMRAYIDLSGFSENDVKLDESARTMTVTLPAVQTEFAGRDAAFREEHYRVTGLRSAIDAGERAEIKESMNRALKEEVERDETFRRQLTESAKARGRRYFEDLASRYGYTATVDFK